MHPALQGTRCLLRSSLLFLTPLCLLLFVAPASAKIDVKQVNGKRAGALLRSHFVVGKPAKDGRQRLLIEHGRAVVSITATAKEWRQMLAAAEASATGVGGGGPMLRQVRHSTTDQVWTNLKWRTQDRQSGRSTLAIGGVIRQSAAREAWHALYAQLGVSRKPRGGPHARATPAPATPQPVNGGHVVKGVDAALRLEPGRLSWVTAMHANWVREDYTLNWGSWYPKARAAGLNVLAVVFPNGSYDYGNYVGLLQSHPEIKVAELINEPEWNGESPAEYASNLVTMARNIRAVRPDITLLCTVENASPYQNWDRDMVNAAGVANFNRSCDGLSVHLYTGGTYADPSTRASANSASFSFDRVDRMRAELLAMGVDKPFWVTEFGWSLMTTRISDGQRATYYQHFFDEAATRPWIVGLFPYQLFSYYQDPNNKETGFGLINGSTGNDTAAASVVRDRYGSMP
jgi:hypothetical protein